MTPQKLQDALRKELEEEFQKYLFQNCKGEKIPINVFGQFLPKRNDKEYAKEDGKAEEDLSTLFPQEEMPEEYRGYYPFIQVILLEQISDLDSATQHVSFFIGIHDDNCNNEGTREILNIIEIIRQRFFQNRTVGRSFFVAPNTKFIGLPEDNDTYPYFHGTVDMYFNFCPARKKEDFQYGIKKTRASAELC